MSNARLALLTTLLMLAGGSELSAQSFPLPIPGSVPASCPITTRPQTPFIPPAPYPTQLPENAFWLGTDKLWTNIWEPLHWPWSPHQPGHEMDVQPATAKLFWFRSDYDSRTEPIPKLKITGRKLDGPAPPIVFEITHAGIRPPSAMISIFYVPTPGCWEITGDYKGDKLSFVVWLEPPKQ